MFVRAKFSEQQNLFGFVESFSHTEYGSSRTLKITTGLEKSDKNGNYFFSKPMLFFPKFSNFEDLYETSTKLESGNTLKGLERYVNAKKPIHSLIVPDVLPIHAIVRKKNGRYSSQVNILRPVNGASTVDGIQFAEVSGDIIKDAVSELMYPLFDTDGSRFEFLKYRRGHLNV